LGERHGLRSAKFIRRSVGLVVLLILAGTACGGTGSSDGGEQADIVVDTTFLADIVSNVAGDHLTVISLIPEGADPHSFEPTPKDARLVAGARVVVINSRGLSHAMDDLIAGSAPTEVALVEAAEGLEGVDEDPHCWLDPVSVMTYVDNIAEGLAAVDHEAADDYRANARAYIGLLEELDLWIRTEVALVPADKRLLVTNHESLGWFADRYGLQVVGAIFPTTAGVGSASARQIADLVTDIKNSGAPAIFIETGSNEELARQVAAEAGVVVVSDIHTGSLAPEAPNYLGMMRWNVERITRALR